MSDQHKQENPAWGENSALMAPALLGASAGLIVGDMMHGSARRGLGLGMGILGVALVAPYVFGTARGLITGPRSKFGVRKRIQSIRDGGMGDPAQAADFDDVDHELREQGVV